jgi:WD40 repeat protein
LSPSTPASSLPGFERSLAVVIGINSYAHGIPPLVNAVRDAQALGNILQRQGFEVLRILDSEATLSTLSEVLSHRIPSLHETAVDRLLIYFAGHGLAHTDNQHRFSGYLLPVDARRDEDTSYWPMTSIREALSQLPCKHLLLILDCCFAGAFPHPVSRDLRPDNQPAPLYLERFRRFSSRRSVQLLISTAHDELASDRLLARPSTHASDGSSHSPFALALLEALDRGSPADFNHDGLLTATELYTFLRDRFVALLPSCSQQTPALRPLEGHDDGEFLFLLSDAFPTLPPAEPLFKDSNPYLGLRPFSSTHRHLFFGRERHVHTLLKKLESHPLLLLCGPSGAGKSSLVHAGLLPRLAGDSSWLVPPSLRPSSTPLQQLSSWFASLGPQAPSQEALAAQPHLAATFINSFLATRPDRSVLLVVDPLEELVTACLDDSRRRAFLLALFSLLHLSHPRLRLLLLLRSDFEPHFLALLQGCALPLELWYQSRSLLPPMNRDELRLCIEKPAETCVLFFAPGLVERLLDDVEQMPGALPLLSMALSELFDAYLDSGREDRTFSFEDYTHIGNGIAGSLQRRAELIFSGVPLPLPEGQPTLPAMSREEIPAFQRTLRNVLLRMVSPEGGELTRRRVPRSELEYPHAEENARVQRALLALEACRLVVASDEAGPCVEPAHDALLSSWPRLHDWARNTQRELLLLRRVSHAAAEWHRHQQAPTFLWADARLDQLGHFPAALPPAPSSLAFLPTFFPSGQPAEPLAFNSRESDFLRASAARQRSLRTRRYALALTVATSLVALTAAALFQADKANSNAARALEQQAEAERQKVAAEAATTEARRQAAAAEAAAAKEEQQRLVAEASTREARRRTYQALANARLTQAQQLLKLDPTKALLVIAEVSGQPEASTTDWRQAALDISQRAIASAILEAQTAELSPTDSRVLTTSGKTMRLWRLDGKGRPLVFEDHPAEVKKAVFSPDGSRILTVASDHTARIWRSDGTGKPRVLDGHRRLVNSATFSPDSSHVLTASNDGTVRIWRVDESGSPPVILDHNARVESAFFSPDGSRILTTASDNAVRLWPTDGKSTPFVFKDETEVRSAFFSPDGSRIVILFGENTVLVRRGDSLVGLFALPHPAKVQFAEFSPDGSRLLTGSSDDTVHIWHADGSNEPLILDHASGLKSAFFSPDGSRVLTSSPDNTARIWRTDGQEKPVILEGHTGSINHASFSPDNSQVATASNDNTVRIWRTDGKGKPSVLEGHTNWVNSVTFSFDGAHVLSDSSDGTVRVWPSTGSSLPLVLNKAAPTLDERNRSGFINRVVYEENDADGFASMALYADDGPGDMHTSGSNTRRVWRADGTGTPYFSSTDEAGANYAAFSPDGSRILATFNDGTVRLWRANGHGAPLRLKHEERVNSASFSPDGSRLLTLSSDNTVHIWSTNGQGGSFALSHTARATSASFSPDGSRILTLSGDDTAWLWRADGSGAPLVLGGVGGRIDSAVFSPDGSRILTVSDDNIARIWSANGGAVLLQIHGPTDRIKSAVFSPDGSRVLGILDSGIFALRADGDGLPHYSKLDKGKIESATFNPDGSRILVISDERKAYMERTDGKRGGYTLTWLNSAIFSPDGSRVVALSDENAVIVRTDGSGKPLFLKGHTRRVNSVVISRDGAQVLTASDDGTARIWRANGEGVPLVLNHTGMLNSATFSPDGSLVATASSQGALYIWPISPPLLRAALRNATGVCLSTLERERYLLESPQEAQEGHARCERSHNRSP